MNNERGWERFSQAMRGAQGLPQKMGNWVEDLRAIPDRASDIAEGYYGDSSARDASAKNAFRHALGTGMLAQKLGGGPLGAVAAKMIGWGWEAPTLLSSKSTPAERQDSGHDLNANALGAWVAMQSKDQAELVNALRGYAARSVVADPPPIVGRHPGYLTRSVR